jgi:release factor glutamine methyltransferase
MTAAPTWEDLGREAAAALGDRREARWMVEEASGGAIGVAPAGAARRLREMVERRRAGEPLQYVLGSWSFRALDLMVDRRVLIPRQETEAVVDVALVELDRLRAGREGPATVVDLGTGSGAIALSVARERPGVEVWATDRSADALAVAAANLAGTALTGVRLVEGDWWSALPPGLRGRVDLGVANPPYVSRAEMAGLDPVVRDWEPRLALEAGPEGTEAIRAVLVGAGEWLAPAATLVIEIAPHQERPASDLARAFGFYPVRVDPDLAGRPRVLVAGWRR